MTTVHLIHGFNVADGGRSTVGRLEPYFASEGFRVVVHDYGWVGPLLLRFRNRSVVKKLKSQIKRGDILVGHSNGALICWRLVEAGAPVSKVLVIQPCLRRDAQWPEHVKVFCVWNEKDLPVLLGRVWGRLISGLTFSFHGWGAAGRYGFNPAPNVKQTRSTDSFWGRYAVGGHSRIFQQQYLVFWGVAVAGWVSGSMMNFLSIKRI